MDEPGKGGWESRVEPARIDAGGDALDDRGAAARAVAAGTVGVVGFQLAENAGAVQEVVYQGIDRDHHRAGLDPDWPLGSASATGSTVSRCGSKI